MSKEYMGSIQEGQDSTTSSRRRQENSGEKITREIKEENLLGLKRI